MAPPTTNNEMTPIITKEIDIIAIFTINLIIMTHIKQMLSEQFINMLSLALLIISVYGIKLPC